MRRFFFLFLCLLSPIIVDANVSKAPFLVTGCARSGTTYVTAVLRRSGLKIGHEEWGPQGCVAWQLAADANYTLFNWNFPKGKLDFDVVIHLVRDPIKVINSMYGRTVSPNNLSWEHAWRYIVNCCPEISRNDPVPVKCAKYWYYWNLKAERKSVMTLRIEDFHERLDEFSHMIGFQIDPNIANKVPQDINHHAFPNDFRVTWAYLEKNLEPSFFRKLQELAVAYGYPIEDKVVY